MNTVATIADTSAPEQSDDLCAAVFPGLTSSFIGNDNLLEDSYTSFASVSSPLL